MKNNLVYLKDILSAIESIEKFVEASVRMSFVKTIKHQAR